MGTQLDISTISLQIYWPRTPIGMSERCRKYYHAQAAEQPSSLVTYAFG